MDMICGRKRRKSSKEDTIVKGMAGKSTRTSKAQRLNETIPVAMMHTSVADED